MTKKFLYEVQHVYYLGTEDIVRVAANSIDDALSIVRSNDPRDQREIISVIKCGVVIIK